MLQYRYAAIVNPFLLFLGDFAFSKHAVSRTVELTEEVKKKKKRERKKEVVLF